MTPKEVMFFLEAYNNKEMEDIKKILIGAWHQAAFQRAKKMPELSKVIDICPKENNPKEINYQKIARVAKEKGLKIPKSFIDERRKNDG